VSASVEGYASFSAGGSAEAGTHTLVVQSLATTDRWAFDGVADPDQDLATVDGQGVSFTYQGVSYSATVGATDSSLNEIAAAINGAAGSAVSATVVNSGTGAAPSWKLVLTAKDTGEDFRIESLSSTVTKLTVDGTGPDANGVALSANNLSVGGNAVAVIDGLTVERTDNDFDDVVAGVSISLLAEDPAKTIQFTVEPDKTAIKSKIGELVAAYNDVITFVRQQNRYDPDKGPGGPLFGDNALDAIVRTAQGVLFGQSAAQVANDPAGFGTLRLLGIESQSDGTLKIKDSVMDAKMDEDLDRFADLFADTDGFDNGGVPVGDPNYYVDLSADTGLGDDLARAIDRIVDGYGDGSGNFYKGVFDARIESLNARIDTLNDRIEQREMRLERYEEQLVRRFAALESLMAQLQSQSAYFQ
jgi:flagellar hook-associated protein 2